MPVMKACAFTHFENSFGDTARASRESVDTVAHAEEVGFEQVYPHLPANVARLSPPVH